MKKFLFSICFFISLSNSIFALPIDLTKNWYVTKGFEISENPDGKQWKTLESLPLSTILKQFEWEKGKLRKVTMAKSFLLSPTDFQKVEDDAFSLHVPYISNYFAIYINQSLVTSGGSIKEDSIETSGYRRHIIVRLKRSNLKVGQNQIRILVAAEEGEELNVYDLFNDFPTNINLASNHSEIEDETLTYMLLFLYFFVGIYHGLFYWKRRQETYNLYYALFSIFLAIYMVFRTQGIYSLGLEPFAQTKIEYFVVFLTPSWLLLFTDLFFRSKISIVSKTYLVFSVLLAITQFFVNRATSVLLLRIWQVSVFVFGVILLYLIISAVRAKNKDAKRLLMGVLFLLGTGSWDVIGASGILPIQNLNLLRFGYLFFVLGIAVVLANRFLRVHRQVESLNLSLERKVEERTNELQNTLTKVQELKVQQDGDYFLTSLLLDPLGQTKVNSTQVLLQAFVKQKKEFEFRGKKREIGGDIIISDSITLNGKSYLVFINGDAMGKSIQGAGGALVLGVVFLSFIKRTQMILENQNKSPERWIKECFFELQTIFESFDGSMLVSVVLGLVEEDTGVLYYLNAEHPWTVLYRDGVASFIEEELELRKIGTKGMDGDVRIRIFPLETGDVLFIGSDGRDDLVLEESGDGNRLINEDETKFLEVVEKSKGDLNSIVENLLDVGTFSDDLTLLRLEWLGSFKRVSKDSLNHLNSDDYLYSKIKSLLDLGKAEEAFQTIETFLANESLQDDIRINLIREKSRISLLLKKFDIAVDALESIFPYFVTDNEILLQLSFAYRKSKNIKKAIELGERLRARDPKHIRNLINLVECYRLVGNLERAKKIFSRLAALSPEHPQVVKLREVLGSLQN
ncbi:SpoIIE-like protein phosphatase domain protein [Leptospira yanagawae serovar Saopaulo str. Sao Paulo = ATCC 700523]|uniref:SpoIIE-like protein phosphatase domain protein n=1 Tax=Leptospira yanagawae serovar Saopaulo str. Sao Paulo = ATCC 700523 TaxID=1249483 RepID=A0A5E8HC40_9LEPT|nr:SpoIIE family protein phosphatase [Leptospira yanagawae]EOQ89011.1 SpoIIE-like protein phosphatase domain protein [Leptospira yanagawae serovar Saopaulo str. Sao Paulo = ATCC 700523]